MHAGNEKGGRPDDRLRIVIVDDHPVLRRGLAQVIADELDMVICGESATSAETLPIVAEARPDVVILDLALGTDDGLEVIPALAAAHPGVRVLVLSMRDELLYADRALREGACGYIMKHEAISRVLAAIRLVAAGRVYVSDMVSARMVECRRAGERSASISTGLIERLTSRELRVFELVGLGLGTRDIARQLRVSPRTVESHCAHIKDKLGLETARQLVRLAATWSDDRSSSTLPTRMRAGRL